MMMMVAETRFPQPRTTPVLVCVGGCKDDDDDDDERPFGDILRRICRLTLYLFRSGVSRLMYCEVFLFLSLSDEKALARRAE
ncbi:60 kDa SS-A/Ro ribonucleoprotein-like protein [Anopheles sinensis]|uniref:60 kDa SS-A/Ro ribonucleoprotein-like protein n=1 Tax=Anopheles sinensis TaxID=74873 RepID=A0A084VQS6_ANOSI|nr:60 kDa SS-A/Ro ribonucleoprotein-like protein [Anopheles sinensis]